MPGRLPGSRAALARVLRGARLVVSAGRYPAAEARRVVPDLTASLVEIPPGVDAGAIVPLKAAERRAARAAPRPAGPGPAARRASAGWCRARAWTCSSRPPTAWPPRTRTSWWPSPATAGSWTTCGAWPRQSPVTVEVLGRVSEEDRAALLGAADVFVMACRNRWLGLEQEGFGIVFLEAAAAGVPQVAGDSGGASEAVLDGETGLVVADPGDPGAVAEALREPPGRPQPAAQDGPGRPI